ncbi:MAG: protein TolR [Spongiibacteraceae bacterium]|jgi:biopolymer transport protein TolR|nr:protein TolR [Spongiibacteraceae bacterium]
MARSRKRHSAVAEINVVPYIDVTLVLLIIFMVTTPLLVQGVQVDLPKASARPIEKTEESTLIVSVDRDGNYFLKIGSGQNEPVAAEEIQERVSKVLRRSPETPVFVWGDRQVPYGDVVGLMTVLQGAGAPAVGLVTEEATPK